MVHKLDHHQSHDSGKHNQAHGDIHQHAHGDVHQRLHNDAHQNIHSDVHQNSHGDLHQNLHAHVQQHLHDEVHSLLKSSHDAQQKSRDAHQKATDHLNKIGHHQDHPDTLIFTPLGSEKIHPVPKHIIDFGDAAVHVKGIDSTTRSGEKTALTEPARAGDKSAPAAKPHFDATKSVDQNIKEGTFKHVTDTSAPSDHKPVEAGKAPKITVVYENKHPDAHTPKPNYIVQKDGTISVVHNPEGAQHDANIVIQVARGAKETGLPDKTQQKAVDDLVEYQAARIVGNFGKDLKDIPTAHGSLKQVVINDAQNLVSDKVEQKFGEKLTPDASKLSPPAVPADVKQTSDLMNRIKGSGGCATIPRESAHGRHAGDGTPAGVDQMIPSRSVPQAPKEANSIAAAKDAAAALFNPDHSHPYQTIRENSDHSYRVGRYGLNQGFTIMGLAELMGVNLGDPPDMAKLQAFMRDPKALEYAIQSYVQKVNQDADKAHLAPNDPVRESAKVLGKFGKSLEDPQFRNDFVKFVADMKGDGQPLTQDRLATFMPKELQELLAEKGITHEAKMLGENSNNLSEQAAGKISLAFLLGRTPNGADTENSQYADYTRAGANMYKLAESRQHNLGDINVSDAQGKIIAAAAGSIGQPMWQKYLNGGRLGCAASVSAVLNEAGFSYANAVGVSALQDQLMAHGWTVSTHPQAGDVVCGYRRPKGSGASGQAHTGIVGPDGTWDNHSGSKVWSHDSLSAWNSNAYKSGVVFLQPPQA